MARIFFEAVRAHLRAKEAVGEGTGDEGARREIGAVSFVQRLGSHSMKTKTRIRVGDMYMHNPRSSNG